MHSELRLSSGSEGMRHSMELTGTQSPLFESLANRIHEVIPTKEYRDWPALPSGATSIARGFL